MNISTPWMDGIGCGSNVARSHGHCESRARCAPRPSATRSPSGRRGGRSTRAAPKRSAPSRSTKASPRTRAWQPRQTLTPTQSPVLSTHWPARRQGKVSFVRLRTFTGPAYGLLLDASSPDWRQRIRNTDDFPALLAGAFGVQPATDATAAAARYGGSEIRAAEEQRERGRQERLAELRQRFVDGPVLVIRGGGGGMSNSMGAVVIPDVGTVFFGPYRHNGDSGALVAEKGVLLESDGRVRRVPAPVRKDDTTAVGDGWIFTARPGWVLREGSRRGDYEVVRQQP